MSKAFIAHIPLSSIASSALTVNFQEINLGGLPVACESITVLNDSNQGVAISFDGSTSHKFIPAGGNYTVSTPAGLRNANKKGTTVSAKGTAGTGNVYLSGAYIPL